VSSTRTKRYWGTQRVARICQVTPATVAKWIDQGLLKGHKTPTGRRRVVDNDLTAFLRTHGMPVPPELLEGADKDVVVLVEDDPAYLQVLVRIIQMHAPEIELVTATNGVDGLLAIGKAQPDLVVLDYKLPDLNAVQILERLLEPGREIDTEIMVVTGGMPDDAEAQLHRVGVKTIVDKADGLDAVVDAIRRLLSVRKAA
jgi:CheY-like chemotaxis protein